MFTHETYFNIFVPRSPQIRVGGVGTDLHFWVWVRNVPAQTPFSPPRIFMPEQTFTRALCIPTFKGPNPQPFFKNGILRLFPSCVSKKRANLITVNLLTCIFHFHCRFSWYFSTCQWCHFCDVIFSFGDVHVFWSGIRSVCLLYATPFFSPLGVGKTWGVVFSGPVTGTNCWFPKSK